MPTRVITTKSPPSTRALAGHRKREPASAPQNRVRTLQDTVKELEALRSKYGSLLTTAKSHEEMAGRAAREGQLRAEEVRKKRRVCQEGTSTRGGIAIRTHDAYVQHLVMIITGDHSE